MGEIRDAIETLTDMKATFAEAGIYNTKRSISASAMEGTANFPVLVDDSLSIDDGLLISRAMEKKFASFLLTTLTMDPFLEVTKGETPSASAYLKQFHQNMRVSNPDKGFHLNLTDYATFESEAFRYAYAVYEGVKQSLPQDINVRCNYTVEEVTSPDTLNGRFRTLRPIVEADGDVNVNNSLNVDTVELTNHAGGTVNFDPNTRVIDRSVTVNPRITIQGNGITNGGNGNGNCNNVRNRGNQWKPMTDNDVKKANDLVPTLLHIRVYPIDKYTREELTPIDFIMGVKATLHLIPVQEISRMVVSAMRNENMVFNFIRWTTGEIKFFKDFLFAIDSIKMDAKDSGKDVTGWRPALKRRKNNSKLKVRLTKNAPLPNSSMVITQPTIDYIAETYGYNLSDERIVSRMMNTYFLLSFVTVNPVSQRASFRFDGIHATDTYTFDTLRRENQSNDKEFKNMMKMLGRSM